MAAKKTKEWEEPPFYGIYFYKIKKKTMKRIKHMCYTYDIIEKIEKKEKGYEQYYYAKALNGHGTFSEVEINGVKHLLDNSCFKRLKRSKREKTIINYVKVKGEGYPNYCNMYYISDDNVIKVPVTTDPTQDTFVGIEVTTDPTQDTFVGIDDSRKIKLIDNDIYIPVITKLVTMTEKIYINDKDIIKPNMMVRRKENKDS